MESILGNIGDQDVFDASELTLKACKDFPDQIDGDKVGITGGSFGGFLTTWLIGHPKYNYIWKAAVAWNAIVDLNYMSVCADVPDWCFAVAMRKKMEEAQITKEEVTALFERSPISVVQNVNCPTCLLAGQIDLRTPPDQSYRYMHSLKKRGIPHKLISYPGEAHLLDNKFETVADN